MASKAAAKQTTEKIVNAAILKTASVRIG